MAKITDPDLLTQGTEIEFITGSLIIKLNAAGNLTQSDGVSLQTVYSFIKEEWKNDDNLIRFAFPMTSITAEQFELINGWNWSGSADVDVSSSHYYLRDGGWSVVSPDTGNNTEEWMNITTLGSFNASTDRAYYIQQSQSADIVQNTFSDAVNQGIQIFASGAANYDYRNYFNIFLRERAKTYANYELLTEQNLSELTFRKFALPLANATDLNISATDNTIATTSPYTGMAIKYFTSSQAVDIGGTNYNFKVEIQANQGTKQEIYEFVQYSLRQASNIDTLGNIPTGVTGSVAEELLEFVGSNLKTKLQSDVGGTGAGGVHISDFRAADTNDLTFVDDNGDEQTFPFVAAGQLIFNTNLQNDAAAIYKLFFTNDDAGDNTGRDFGTQNAIIINKNDGSPITGSVATSASVDFDYDFDGNIQRGNGSSGSIVPFTGVALGLGTAQYVVTTGNITRATSNPINFVAALERNYLNPA